MGLPEIGIGITVLTLLVAIIVGRNELGRFLGGVWKSIVPSARREPPHAVRADFEKIVLQDWSRVNARLMIYPVDPAVITTITDVRAKFWPKRAPVYAQELRPRLQLPSKIGGGRPHEGTTIEYPVQQLKYDFRDGQDDLSGLLVLQATINYVDPEDRARTLVVERDSTPVP